MEKRNCREYLKQERIMIGIAQSAIEGRSRETKEQHIVFGFAANASLNPQEFMGGFRYHKDTEVRLTEGKLSFVPSRLITFLKTATAALHCENRQ